jgi:nucleotide-binding universal stress UspA family protein
MFNVIIWGSDGSEHADRALAYARNLAEATSTRLVAVHVKEITVGRGGGYPVQTDEEEIEQKIQTQVEDLKAAGSTQPTSSWKRPREAPLTRSPTLRRMPGRISSLSARADKRRSQVCSWAA